VHGLWPLLNVLSRRNEGFCLAEIKEIAETFTRKGFCPAEIKEIAEIYVEFNPLFLYHTEITETTEIISFISFISAGQKPFPRDKCVQSVVFMSRRNKGNSRNYILWLVLFIEHKDTKIYQSKILSYLVKDTKLKAA